MNKKLLFVFVMLAAFLVACGGGGADLAALQSEVDGLKSQLSAAESAAADAQAELADAKAMAEEAMASAGESSGEVVMEAVTFAGGGDTLGSVQAAGVLKCGNGAGSAPGFAFIGEDGSWTGKNSDFCRAVAAAVLGDSEAVEFIVTTGTTRFPLLQSGDVDVLINNTTWTFSRDTSLGFNFAPTIFYDGQGMVVRRDSGITDLEGLEGGSVCVATGTTTEKNLADVMRQLDVDYEAVTFEDTGDVTRSAFEGGRCDGWTGDKSGLLSGSTLFADFSEYMVLDATMSKEPLGPLVRHGDDNWFDIVKWVTNCTIQAEELGITQANVDDMLGSDDPAVLNTLGVEGDLGQAIGLNNDFCYQVISQMGNYGDIYDRHLGPDTAFNLSRGVNAQWTNGGLLYSPPFR